MDWIEVATRVGLPAVVLYLVGRWFAASGWPFITAAWSDSQEERRQERRDFAESLDKLVDAIKALDEQNRIARDEARDKFLEALAVHGIAMADISQSQETSVRIQREIKDKLDDCIESKEQ